MKNAENLEITFLFLLEAEVTQAKLRLVRKKEGAPDVTADQYKRLLLYFQQWNNGDTSSDITKRARAVLRFVHPFIARELAKETRVA